MEPAASFKKMGAKPNGLRLLLRELRNSKKAVGLLALVSLALIAPGIVATLLLWLISGAVFGRYLATYAFTYVSMYAGLASVMIALVFLYVCSSIFIFGGELNSAIAKARHHAD